MAITIQIAKKGKPSCGVSWGVDLGKKEKTKKRGGARSERSLGGKDHAAERIGPDRKGTGAMKGREEKGRTFSARWRGPSYFRGKSI